MSNFNKLVLVLAGILVVVCFILVRSCSSDYIWVKVQKSVLIPDSYELNRDSLVAGGMRICKMAQRYYDKSATVGGGGNTFTGFTIPPHLIKAEYGEFALNIVRSQMIRVTCTGMLKGFDQFNPMKVEFVVTSKDISSIILN